MSMPSTRSADRAVALLWIWGVACLALDAFMKLWVKNHPSEYASFVTTAPARVLGVAVLVLCVLACPLGLALAIRDTRYWSVRVATVAGGLGYLAMLASWLPGWFQVSPRQIMGPLYWFTMVAMLVVVGVGIAWLLERRGVSASAGQGAR